MSHTLTLSPTPKRDPIFLWLALIAATFLLLPAWSLDYGLLDASRDELLAAYSWSSLNISLLWFLLPVGLLARPLLTPGRNSVAATVLTRLTRCSVPFSWSSVPRWKVAEWAMALLRCLSR